MSPTPCQLEQHLPILLSAGIRVLGKAFQFSLFHFSGCGATLTSPSGTITTPRHPTNYPHGANCTWYINIAQGNLVRLTFDSFNLEYHADCNFDYVEVYDNGTVETGNKIGR